MPNFKLLIAELESAKEGSRELDWQIGEALNQGWAPDQPPSYTTILDSAMTLVPENWFWDASNNPKTGGFARLTDIPAIGEQMQDVKAFASTPALAFSAAALKARDNERI